jgi:hypothetical protein
MLLPIVALAQIARPRGGVFVTGAPPRGARQMAAPAPKKLALLASVRS